MRCEGDNVDEHARWVSAPSDASGPQRVSPQSNASSSFSIATAGCASPSSHPAATAKDSMSSSKLCVHMRAEMSCPGISLLFAPDFASSAQLSSMANDNGGPSDAEGERDARRRTAERLPSRDLDPFRVLMCSSTSEGQGSRIPVLVLSLPFSLPSAKIR